MTTKRDIDRRTFLRSASGAASIAAAAVVMAPALATDAQAYDPGEDETGAKYQAEGADVQAFYRTNGYETLGER